jgi:hypothetical protein
MEYSIEDDDMPPMLIDSAAPRSKANELEEIGDALGNLNLVKVPITIVTGTSSKPRQLHEHVFCLPVQI